jgi:hypothetical protein
MILCASRAATILNKCCPNCRNPPSRRCNPAVALPYVPPRKNYQSGSKQMRNFMKVSLAVGAGAFVLGWSGLHAAKAADTPYPQGQYEGQYEGPPPQAYEPPPAEEGYGYPPPPPPVPYAFPPQPAPYYEYGSPYVVVPGPYYGRGPYWGGYPPHYAYGYGHWGYGYRRW